MLRLVFFKLFILLAFIFLDVNAYPKSMSSCQVLFNFGETSQDALAELQYPGISKEFKKNFIKYYGLEASFFQIPEHIRLSISENDYLMESLFFQGENFDLFRFDPSSSSVTWMMQKLIQFEFAKNAVVKSRDTAKLIFVVGFEDNKRIQALQGALPIKSAFINFDDLKNLSPYKMKLVILRLIMAKQKRIVFMSLSQFEYLTLKSIEYGLKENLIQRISFISLFANFAHDYKRLEDNLSVLSTSKKLKIKLTYFLTSKQELLLSKDISDQLKNKIDIQVFQIYRWWKIKGALPTRKSKNEFNQDSESSTDSEIVQNNDDMTSNQLAHFLSDYWYLPYFQNKIYELALLNAPDSNGFWTAFERRYLKQNTDTKKKYYGSREKMILKLQTHWSANNWTLPEANSKDKEIQNLYIKMKLIYQDSEYFALLKEVATLESPLHKKLHEEMDIYFSRNKEKENLKAFLEKLYVYWFEHYGLFPRVKVENENSLYSKLTRISDHKLLLEIAAEMRKKGRAFYGKTFYESLKVYLNPEQKPQMLYYRLMYSDLQKLRDLYIRIQHQERFGLERLDLEQELKKPYRKLESYLDDPCFFRLVDEMQGEMQAEMNPKFGLFVKKLAYGERDILKLSQ